MKKKCSLIASFVFLVFCHLSAELPPITPPALRKGDTIAVIAPASCPEEDQQCISRWIKQLTQKGYRVKTAPNLMKRYGYLAGTDEERAKAFMDAWLDPEVKALWCYRGGYGTTRILDQLDYQVIKSHPKILIGMSDATALHAAINKKTGLITFLGPNMNNVYGNETSRDSLYSEKQLWEMIAPTASFSGSYRYRNPKTFPTKEQSVSTIRPGVARGRLAGGTLSLITSLVGTPWEIETKGRILVLEEVDEEPYQIDRMLCQMKNAGCLDELAGVLLCSWRGCSGKRPHKSLSLERVFKEYFENAPYPVMVGFPSGHIPDQTTLPMNALAELDATNKIVRVLEVPVEVHP